MPGKRFAKVLPQRDRKSFGQKAVFCGFLRRRRGDSEFMAMCGRTVVAPTYLDWRKHEKADFLRTKSGQQISASNKHFFICNKASFMVLFVKIFPGR
jgi:hypothetical protein